MPRLVFLNKYWYFQMDCRDSDKETVSEAVERFTDKIPTETLKLDNGNVIVMPKDIVEETSFFVDDGE